MQPKKKKVVSGPFVYIKCQQEVCALNIIGTCKKECPERKTVSKKLETQRDKGIIVTEIIIIEKEERKCFT